MYRIYKYIFIFCSLMVSPILSDSQILQSLQSEQDACHAIPICGNFTCPYVYTGFGNVQEQLSTYGGCIDEANSVWLKIKIATPGTIVFTINPMNSSNAYNFSLHSVSGGVPCSTILLNTPIRCIGYNSNGPTGLVSGIPSGSFLSAVNANAGDEYLILVNQTIDGINYPYIYANGFSIDFTGSTATFINDSLPFFNDVRNTCNKSQQVTVKFTEPVKCTSIATNGSDFYLTPSLQPIIAAYSFNCTQDSSYFGFSDEATIKFNSPLPVGNYWLHVKKGSDGNTFVDLCGDELTAPDSIAFSVDAYASLSFTGLDSPACQFLVVGLSNKVICDSIASNGSDFKVVGPSSVLVSEASATNCDIHGLADTILVTLQSPIQVDGVYYLVSQKGSDNNTLIDTCTGQQLPGDKTPFIISSFGPSFHAEPDTILCKADTITLRVENLSWMDVTDCGVTSVSKKGITITKEVTGMPGTSTFYGPPQHVNSIFNASYYGAHNSRKQIIFRASELLSAGLKPGSITKIGWLVDKGWGGVQDIFPPPPPWLSSQPFITWDNFTIKIGCSAVSDFGSGLMAPNLKTVFTTTGYMPVMGVNEFILDSAYNWDGWNNLVIEVCGGATQFIDTIVNSTTYFLQPAQTKYSTTTFYSSCIYTTLLPEDGCSLTGTNNDGPLGVVVRSTKRPDTRFTICSPPLPEGGPYHWTPSKYITGDTAFYNTTGYTPVSTTFTVTTTDRFGCYLKDTAQIVLSELNPSINPSEVSICKGDSVKLEANSGTDLAYFSWITDSPVSLSCLTCSAPSASPIDSTRYSVIIKDKYGCIDTLFAKVNVKALPLVVANPQDTIVKYGAGVQLSANGADFYSWFPAGTLSIPFINNPVANPIEPTDYIVVGVASNNCRNSDTIHVAIDYRSNLFVPSAFSPNNDGLNDIFKVINLTFQKIQEFKIFNRWGQAVYSALDNNGWDGRFKGELQGIGVYQYLIKVGFPDGGSQTYKGDLTLTK